MARMQTASAISLIAVEGQERALTELDDIEALARTHGPRLLRFVAFSVRDADVAASIVQDCLLKAYNSRERFRNECSVSTWLMTIASNLVRDHQRIRKYQFWRNVEKTAVDVMEMASLLPNRERSPEGQVLARERARAVACAVDSLSPRQRIVFLMRYSEEMELAEIAAATGMPLNTVKTHLFRAVRAVRAQVGAKGL